MITHTLHEYTLKQQVQDSVSMNIMNTIKTLVTTTMMMIKTPARIQVTGHLLKTARTRFLNPVARKAKNLEANQNVPVDIRGRKDTAPNNTGVQIHRGALKRVQPRKPCKRTCTCRKHLSVNVCAEPRMLVQRGQQQSMLDCHV